MSRNSNPSINSPASTNNTPSTTAISNNTTFTKQLLTKFNNHQTRHISVSLTAFSVQYIPHSPTPSIQEVSSPPPLQVHLAPNPEGHYPPISPELAKMILYMDDNSDLHDTAHTITYGLISTIRKRTDVANQSLAEACCHIAQLTASMRTCEIKIHCLWDRAENIKMPPTFKHNGG